MTTEPPPTSAGCRVTPLIDGVEHSAALAAALDRVGHGATPADNAGQVILIAGWWLGLARGRFELTDGGRLGSALKIPGARLLDGEPYRLDPLNDGPPLLEVLKAKARAGVDVRVLGWVSPTMRWHRIAARIGAGHIVAINTLTMRSIAALREEPAIGGRAMPNLVAHAAGSTHSKIFLVCDGEDTVAFTGGLDLEASRWARHEHAGRETWHDVVAQVEGPAVQGVFDHFKAMWDANLARPAQTFTLEDRPLRSVLPDSPALPPRVLPVRADAGSHVVQTLETLPVSNYARLTWLPKSRPFPEAPRGRFTYRDALQKAIAEAEDYVYIEDQMHWSREVMDRLGQALREHERLRVVLLMSGADDPNDPPLPHDAYLAQAVNRHLLAGLDAQQAGRVHAWRRVGVTVHAKTVIVDDRWAAIGSGNIGARSLYTDVEHGVAFTDPAGELVPAYRARLWSHHLGSAFTELDASLERWAGPGDDTGDRLARVELPVPEVPYPARLDRQYRGIHDPDSRRRWGGLVPPGML